ncbi:hypothetical protein DL93DRAFT_2123877 [Clavulina sp. PMI_390]|nr:hypothetical protein DL93DRAFT_2123877 [Clavulina sp. PMI_390]
MASLEKLLIRGIRSFDDKQASVIEFYTPVTVIVGHNGSGKTTIIECLKYATTGDQPPNTKGGAFVHDPKIANEKEVKAQVKLRFTSANLTQMLAVRNLQVTVKKTGMTMKTLEALLAKYPYTAGDKRGVLSTKCAELDSEIPNLLGVSKAVLENVIFCHQEDSYWPLAEASVLKKKFDDIFEATKYTKALTAIKDLRKERVAELKAEKERLNYLQIDKTRAEKLRTTIKEVTEAISRLEADEEELVHEVNRVEKENAAYYATATQFNQTYTIVDGLEHRIEELKRDITDQERTTQEVTDTDEELEAKIQNHNRHKAQLERESQRIKATLNDAQGHLEEEREMMNKTTRQLGQLQAEAKAHEQKLLDREQLIRALAATLGIKGFDHTPLPEDRVKDFEDKLKEIQSRRSVEYDKLISAGNKKADTLSKNLMDLQNNQTAFRMERGAARDTIARLNDKIATSDSLASEKNGSEAKLTMARKELVNRRQQYDSALEEFTTAKYDASLKDKAAERERLEADKNSLNTRMRSLTLQADTRARLAIKKAEMGKKKKEIDMILETSTPQLKQLADVEPQAATMEKDVEEAIAEREKAASAAEQNAAKMNSALAQIEKSMSTINDQLRAKRNEIKSLSAEITRLLESQSSGDDKSVPENVSAAIEATQAEADELKEHLSTISASREFFVTYLKAGRTGHVCKLCDHAMNEDEWKAFEKKMTKLIGKSEESQLNQTREDLAWCEEHMRSLQALLPKEANRDRLKSKEVPALEKEYASLQNQLEESSQEAEKASNHHPPYNLWLTPSQLRELRTLHGYATTVTRSQSDVERLQKEIKELEVSLASSGSTETTDDLQVKIDAIDTKIKAVERERQNIEMDRDTASQHLRKYQNEIHEGEMLCQRLEVEVQDRQRLLQTIAEQRAEVETSQARMKVQKILELDGLISELDEPITRLNQEIDDHKQKLDQEVRVVGKANRRARELQKCEDRLVAAEKAIADAELEARKKSEELAAVTKQEHEGGATFARYNDNLRLRRLRAKLEQLQAEHASYDMDEAARAKRNFEKKWPAMTENLDRLKDKRARIGGELSTQQGHLTKFEQDMKADFNDIHKRYTDQLVRVKVSDMANNDLEKYAKALDNAIMKYHSLKMEEVNETMRHLWNKTYQGTDIDGIRITSDNDKVTASRTSYNYRVVMTKDQVEMDMRGRCSAGQKMLASIIIRLALSDSFGQNCGILALDEPTNALDSENIDALADSLVDIIKERKSMSNFQLIVITHDEKFLQKLGQADVMEYYWRVTRDRSQKSVIERHRFGADGA